MEKINGFETDRLLLVPTTKEYAKDMFENFDKETTRYMIPKSPEKIEDTLQWIYSLCKLSSKKHH